MDYTALWPHRWLGLRLWMAPFGGRCPWLPVWQQGPRLWGVDLSLVALNPRKKVNFQQMGGKACLLCSKSLIWDVPCVLPFWGWKLGLGGFGLTDAEMKHPSLLESLPLNHPTKSFWLNGETAVARCVGVHPPCKPTVGCWFPKPSALRAVSAETQKKRGSWRCRGSRSKDGATSAAFIWTISEC